MNTATLTEDLAATLGAGYTVTRKITRGWIEVRVNPATALRENLDFLRITEDDELFEIFHQTHNDCCKGSVTLSGSMSAYLPAIVREFCETNF
jgi:hypothetical protein